MQRPWLAALVLSFAAVASVAQSADPGAGERRMQAFLDQVDTLRSAFRQSLFDDRGQLLETSRGVMALSRPDRFRWEYVEPFPQLIVSDGERVWIHDVELEQVTVRRVAGAIETTPASLLSSKRPVRDSFEVLELGERDGLLAVALRPKADDATFAEVRLGFDEGENGGLRLMELLDRFGQTTRLTFELVERNPELDPALFTFEPPPGADVVDDQP
jgi:outer membrane lipoprotein carrier protein